MSKILVTGGSGFIGSHTVEYLLSRGHEVLNFSRTDRKGRNVGDFVQGDIRDSVAVTEAMAHVDGFIHLAGVLGTQETIQNPKPAVATNLGGVLNVLEAAARYEVPGINIAVGNHWENNPYSITKSTAERFVQMYNSYRGTNVNIVRALNAYGPGQSVSQPYGTSQVRKIIPSFVHRALNGEPIEVYGNGLQIMDMVYVDDVAKILGDALEFTMRTPFSEIYGTRVFEAGTGVETCVLEIAHSVLEAVTGKKVGGDPFVVPGPGVKNLPMRPGETGSKPVIASTDSLKPLYGPYGFGFVPLKEGIERTVEFYRG